MPTLPTRSGIYLLPKGPEWSTVTSAYKTDFVTNRLGQLADKERICDWLFNAKTIEYKLDTTDSGGSVIDTTTEILHAGLYPDGILADEAPLPFNEVSGLQLLNNYIIASGVSNRWLTSGGGVSNFDFFVIVYLGEWYWAPHFYNSDQTVSALGANSYTTNQPAPGDGEYIETFTILEKFY